MRYCSEERVYYCCSSGAVNWAAVEAAVAADDADSAAAEEMAFVFVVENSVEGLEMQDC